MFIYLVRHLPTKFNLSGVYMGRSFDIPIATSGVGGFRGRVGALFSQGVGEGVLVFSSPALRCQQTAEVLKDVLGLAVETFVVEAFDETDYGEFEGLHPRQIKARWSGLYHTWMNTPSQITFPGGESFEQVQERSYQKLLELLRECPEGIKTLFVITHVDVIKMLVSKVLSIPIDCKRSFCVDTGSFSLLESIGEEIRVRYLNLRT